MRISDIPEFKDKTEVSTFSPDTPLAEAVDHMATNNFGAVLILEDKKLKGIFTERDLLRRVAAKRVDIEKAKISDVMTSKLKTAHIDDKVHDCLRRMSQGRFRHMPVVDEQGNLKGMLSQGDFVAFTMSDILARASMSAKAATNAGKSTPISIIFAMIIYTLALLFTIAALQHIF